MTAENATMPVPVDTRVTVPDVGLHPRAFENVRVNEILVPIDLSDMSLKALNYAVSFARRLGARLTLLHILEPSAITTEAESQAPSTPREVATVNYELQKIRESQVPPEVAADTVVRCGLAAKAIVNAARELDPDIIIIATHGRTGIKHVVMGSTAEKVVRTATCPVLVVRGVEHDFI